jgi:hypothetical protein
LIGHHGFVSPVPWWQLVLRASVSPQLLGRDDLQVVVLSLVV